MTNDELVAQIDAYLGVNSRVKAAEATTEPDVSTTHPSKDVDDKAQPTSTGSRASENTADVKANVPASVDGADKPTEGASKPPLTDAGFTGEGTNTKDMGKRPDDPGTSAPMNTNIGEKYSSEHLRQLVNRTNAFAAKVAAMKITEAPVTEKKPDKKDEKPCPAGKCAADASEAGKQAAEAVIEKMAADGMNMTATIIKEAADDAQRYADFIAGMTANTLPAIPPVPPSFPKAAAASANAVTLFNIVKRALSKRAGEIAPQDEAAAAMAGGGESSNPDAAADAEGAHDEPDGDEISPEEFEKIIQELESGGVNPDELSNVPPELLAQAIAEADGGGNDGAPVPSETNPEMAS